MPRALPILKFGVAYNIRIRTRGEGIGEITMVAIAVRRAVSEDEYFDLETESEVQIGRAHV